MIILDKSKPSSRVILTLSESSDAEGFILVVHSGYDNTDAAIDLGENISPFKQRYDEFIVPREVFINMNDGQKRYTIVEAVGSKVVEMGILDIVSPQETEYITYDLDETADDFKVFEFKD